MGRGVGKAQLLRSLDTLFVPHHPIASGPSLNQFVGGRSSDCCSGHSSGGSSGCSCCSSGGSSGCSCRSSGRNGSRGSWSGCWTLKLLIMFHNLAPQ